MKESSNPNFHPPTLASDVPLAEIFRTIHYPKGFTFGPHAHRNLEINFVQKGSCYMRFQNDVVRFNKNDIMIIYPEVPHFFGVDKSPASLMQLEFDLAIFPELNEQAGLSGQLTFVHNLFTHSQKYLKISHHQPITQLISQVIDELNAQRLHYQPMVQLLYGQLFLLISRHIKETFKFTELQPNEHLSQALEFINIHFADELDMKSVAAHCQVSTRYLRKLFEQQLSTSPNQYVQQLRINKAKELMHNKSLSIKEIAFESGFPNQPYFTRMFKQSTGLTPAAFRSQLP